MNGATRFREQIRRNSVALISVAIAITSLGYNTWRNEATEHNRNQRVISVEVLRNLADLQLVIYHNAWDMDLADKGNPRTGWVYVLTISDLSLLLDGDVAASATELQQVWDDAWELLGTREREYNRVIAALDKVRDDTHDLLRSLD